MTYSHYLHPGAWIRRRKRKNCIALFGCKAVRGPISFGVTVVAGRATLRDGTLQPTRMEAPPQTLATAERSVSTPTETS
nr:ORF2 [Torque teno felis virus]